MNNRLNFTIHEDASDELGKASSQHGVFSQNWDHEEVLDRLNDRLDAGDINQKQALLLARNLVPQDAANLELQNFMAQRLWALEMRDEATELWAKAYEQATALIPKNFDGQISWLNIDNRTFLRVAHGYLLGLMHQGSGKAAKALAKKMLAWSPSDNLGVRMLLGDINLLNGNTKTAMKSFLKEAAHSPAHWYQAGQIAFKNGDYIAACTYIRRGIAVNPYIAEGLTGRTTLDEHLYWHGSNRNSPEWAANYLNAPICTWEPEEIDFVDWVFNTSHVLKERADLAVQHEGLTYERDPERRDPFAFKSSFFLESITDELSKIMIRKITNRFGLSIWPWDRAGFLRR